MHIIEITEDTKTKLVAALNVHALDPRICVAIRKHAESPAFIAGVIDAWPPDEDGLFRPALSFDHLTVLWRAYALAEIAAGRGLRKFGDDYASELGLTGGDFVPAFDYAAKRLKGAGVRPRHPDAGWTRAMEWVRYDGDTKKPRKFANSTWRTRANMHDACAAADLALPGRGTWNPQATILLMTPKEKPVAPKLSAEDDAALAAFVL
jgi:hypothetical protein